MLSLKVNDKVIVITGDDKGKTGNVKKILKKEKRIIVEGINIVKRHKKPSQTSAGGIEEFEKSIHISNVMLFDSDKSCGTRFKVGTIEDNGKTKKVRISKKSGNIV